MKEFNLLYTDEIRAEKEKKGIPVILAEDVRDRLDKIAETLEGYRTMKMCNTYNNRVSWKTTNIVKEREVGYVVDELRQLAILINMEMRK